MRKQGWLALLLVGVVSVAAWSQITTRPLAPGTPVVTPAASSQPITVTMTQTVTRTLATLPPQVLQLRQYVIDTALNTTGWPYAGVWGEPALEYDITDDGYETYMVVWRMHYGPSIAVVKWWFGDTEGKVAFWIQKSFSIKKVPVTP